MRVSELVLYVWAPSDRAMNGRNDQSLSVAGSTPSSTPNQLSISGPLGVYQPWNLLLLETIHSPSMVKTNDADHRHKMAFSWHVVAVDVVE